MPDDPLEKDLMELLRGIRPEDVARRVKAGEIPCPFCEAKAAVYKDDPRARGWLRYECPNGHWGDRQSL
jgi:transposase-like protein